MRSVLFSALIITMGLMTGCDSMSEHVRERLEPAQPQVRTYAASQPLIFSAAEKALRQIDFRVTRTRAAQGILNGLSHIESGESFGKGRQYAMNVTVTQLDSGETEVAAVLREQEESASFSGATDIPLRQHGLYDSFFAALEAALGKPGTSGRPGN
jgi:hypothetical protein